MRRRLEKAVLRVNKLNLVVAIGFILWQAIDLFANNTEVKATEEKTFIIILANDIMALYEPHKTSISLKSWKTGQLFWSLPCKNPPIDMKIINEKIIAIAEMGNKIEIFDYSKTDTTDTPKNSFNSGDITTAKIVDASFVLLFKKKKVSLVKIADSTIVCSYNFKGMIFPFSNAELVNNEIRIIISAGALGVKLMKISLINKRFSLTPPSNGMPDPFERYTFAEKIFLDQGKIFWANNFGSRKRILLGEDNSGSLSFKEICQVSGRYELIGISKSEPVFIQLDSNSIYAPSL